jgi:hypothetical protein
VAEVAASIRASIESQRTQIAAMPNLREAEDKRAALEKSLGHYAHGEFSEGSAAAQIDQVAASASGMPQAEGPDNGAASKLRGWVVRNAAVWGLGSAAAGIGLSELTGKLTDAKGAATVK